MTPFDAQLALVLSELGKLRADVIELANLADGPPLPQPAGDAPGAVPCAVVPLRRPAAGGAA